MMSLPGKHGKKNIYKKPHATKIRTVNSLPGFESMLQKAILVDFDGLNAHQYYSNKYNDPDKIFCDGDHFNDCVNEEMVRDFITPKLEKAKKVINIKKASTRVLH